ncbi:tripartite tricarboxylate transporter TctB family protein [Qaidamihabitans albus]|uniref:tripartite tricarboxylate transporter TctB family protein n=1 Tax=Qaidamihabitans albus TaxID=2795733 RepID=UPI0018F14E48|nr:tripartite tricarboxylate transporter TctB family protein [Qaidamihabitans albus]
MAEPAGTERPKWTSNRLVGVVCLLSGAAVILHSTALSLGSWAEPGPGMWPLVIGVALVVASVATLTRRLEDTEQERFCPRSLLVVPALLSLYVFIWAFSLFGLTLPGFLLAFFWLNVLGRQGRWISVALAAVATAVFYVLFVPVLGVPFPADILLGGR